MADANCSHCQSHAPAGSTNTAPHAHREAHGHSHADAAAPAAGKVRDPVCGMWVDPVTAKHRHEQAGQTV
ncbi:hypothetical protein ACKI1S_48230, partial [Streptomyces galilaeus]